MDRNSSICLSINWRYFFQISALVHALLFFIFCIFQFYRLLFTLLYLTGNNPKQGDIRAGHGEGGAGGGAGRRDIQWACCLSNLWGPQSFAQPSVLMFCRVEVDFLPIDSWSLTIGQYYISRKHLWSEWDVELCRKLLVENTD